MQLTRFTFIIALLIMATNCQVPESQKSLIKLSTKSKGGDAKVLVAGLENTRDLQSQARALGLKVEGDAVLVLTGPADDIAKLSVPTRERFFAVEDDAVEVMEDTQAAPPDEQIYYLAKRDFGLPDYLRTHPTHDGRGVIVGVIDDGVSPVHNGLQLTTTGERKYLNHTTHSSRLKLKLNEILVSSDRGVYLSSYSEPYQKAWQGKLDEKRPGIDISIQDLNGDGQLTEIDLVVVNDGSSFNVCVDVNVNAAVDAGECFGTFASSGAYGFWSNEKLAAIMAEFDADESTVSLSEGERAGDSHGEGVVSVLVGHKIGGLYDGVAPGAKFVDYDLSQDAEKSEEARYTMATFIHALDWLGQNGAEVANISYSLFFSSAASQQFMHEALVSIIKKHNIVISFSAGNNGPGLGSFNRGLIYPKNTLVAGAFVSKDLDEYVHGVTGLPEPGRVIYYSSRGPSPDGGAAPTVISPLASLTHAAPGDGPRGFSGTSSASPALAGFATILISAAKQLGLPIDPSAIVGAIRLSGVPLVNVPYVEQGAGLPKIAAAIEHYKRLIAGTDFARVDIRSTIVGPDNVKTSGIVLKTSAVNGVFETNLNHRGVLAESVPTSVGSDLIKPVRVEYSASWVSGPFRSYLSVGGANISVQVDLDKLIQSVGERGRDHFGEIKIIDDQTGEWLHTIPVTVIDDLALNQSFSFELNIEPEDGQRLHFNLPIGVTAFKTNVRVLSGNPSALITRVYNPSATSVLYTSATDQQMEYIIPVNTPGWHQVTLSKSKGTANPLKVEVVVTPLEISLVSSAINHSDARVSIVNHDDVQDLRITAHTLPKAFDEKVVATSMSSIASTSWPVEKVGFYSFKIDPVAAGQVINWLPACLASVKNSANETVLTTNLDSNGKTKIEIATFDPGASIEVSCRPFEYVGSVSTGVQHWHFRGFVSEHREEKEIAATVVRLKKGTNEVALPWTTTPVLGTYIELKLEPIFVDSSFANLGKLLVY